MDWKFEKNMYPILDTRVQIKMAGELDNYIERLSTYLQSTGKTYKDHKATILSWFYKNQGSKKKSNIPTWEEYNKGVHL